MKTILISVLLALVAATGCSGDSDEEADAGLIEPQLEAMERAEGVEQDISEAARRQQEVIDEQGG